MKKGLSLVEVIISIFVISIMGIFVMGAVSNFFTGINQMKNIKAFSSNYNNMLNNMYSNTYAGWNLYEANSTGLVMYNTGYVDGLTGFIGYDCLENSITSSNLAFSADEINWDEFDKVFTGITCNSMTGWNVNGGYWINFNISVLENPVDLKYFFRAQ